MTSTEQQIGVLEADVRPSVQEQRADDLMTDRVK